MFCPAYPILFMPAWPLSLARLKCVTLSLFARNFAKPCLDVGLVVVCWQCTGRYSYSLVSLFGILDLYFISFIGICRCACAAGSECKRRRHGRYFNERERIDSSGRRVMFVKFIHDRVCESRPDLNENDRPW